MDSRFRFRFGFRFGLDSAAGDHAVLVAVLRGHVLGLEVVVPRLQHAVEPASTLRVHPPPFGARVLEPNLQQYEVLVFV